MITEPGEGIPMEYQLDVDLGVIDETGALADLSEGSSAFVSQIRQTLQQAIQHAASQNSAPPSRIVLTHPAHWGHERCQLALEAAAAENIPPEVVVLNQATAAPSSLQTQALDTDATAPVAASGTEIKSRAGSVSEPPIQKTAAMPPQVLADLQAQTKQSSHRWYLIAALVAAIATAVVGAYALSNSAQNETDQSAPPTIRESVASPQSQTSTSTSTSDQASILMLDVVGLDLESATETLVELGIQVETEQDSTAAQPQGIVTNQSIGVGEPATAGDVVVLTVSTGGVTGEMPDVIGLNQKQATEILSAAGVLDVTVKVIPDRDANPGQVVRTQPRPGTKLDPGDSVTIFVAAPPGLVSVPNVVGLAHAQAAAKLADAGFQASVEFVDGDGDSAGRVISQDPEPGDKRPGGATIDIEVGRSN